MVEDNELLNRLNEDLNNAKDSHATIMSQIVDWRNKAYLKDVRYTNPLAKSDGKYKSIIKMKDIERTIEQSVSNLVEPFLTNDEMITIKGDGSNEMSYVVQTLLNEQWNDDIDSIDLMNDVARILQVDGTTVLKVGWDQNSPTIAIIPNEEIFFDPSARTIQDINFAIQARRVQISEMLDNPLWFGDHTYEELVGLTSTEPEDRYTNNDSMGGDSDFQYGDGLRQYVDIYEYYGMMQIGDEIKPIVAIFIDSLIINVIDSPYPESWNGIPFELAQYTKRPFSIYGNSVADLISDYQQVRTGFMRAILENANMANSSQKWTKKGALDVLNKRKMENGKDFETNVDPQVAIVQGEFNQVPPSVFQVMEQMKIEEEEISGVTRIGNGTNPNLLNGNVSATAVAVANTNSEKRLLLITRNISSMMQRIFEKMLDLNMMMLENRQLTVMGQDITINRDVLAGSYKLSIHVNTAGSKQAENQNILLMVQQLQANAQLIPNAPEMINKLLAKLSINMNMTSIAMDLKTSSMNNDVMTQQAQQIQQLQMQLEQAKAESEIAKNNAKASLDNAKAVESHVEAQLKAYGV